MFKNNAARGVGGIRGANKQRCTLLEIFYEEDGDTQVGRTFAMRILLGQERVGLESLTGRNWRAFRMNNTREDRIINFKTTA